MLPAKIKTTSEVQTLFSTLSTMKPRDISIAIVNRGLDKILKDYAKSHLDECKDCMQYLSSDKSMAIIKVETNKKVYDFEGDVEYEELLAAEKLAKDNLAAYKKSQEPSHFIQSHYYKATKI